MSHNNVKSMRKGTRACQECRRRKTKCIWVGDSAAKCVECSETERQCTQQGVTAPTTFSTTKVVRSSRLKVRVTRLESVVERLARSLPTPSLDEMSGLDVNAVSCAVERKVEEGKEKDPALFALFKNEVLHLNDDLSLLQMVENTINLPCKALPLNDQLLSTILKETNILSVLDISSSWYPPFQQHHSGLSILNLHLPLRDFVIQNLASDNPVCISVALLGIATSLQTIRPGVDDEDLYLSAPGPEIMTRITATIDQAVISDEQLITCREGVVLLILRAKHHAESNQVRKAWSCIRQAALTAQCMTEHSHSMAWMAYVDGVMETDRFFSMFLGMPHVPNSKLDIENALLQCSGLKGVDEKMRSLRRIVALACGRINDRNSGSEELALSKTEEIQELLDTAVQALPKAWWNAESQVANMCHFGSTFEHLTTQFWFFQTQSFLQLPYMLLATSNSRFAPNREICLNACRNLVKIWILLRQHPSLKIYLCKLDDFQALIATIVVVVGLLQTAVSEMETSHVADLQLLEEVKSVMREAKKEQNGAIAKQGLHVLETLSDFLPGGKGCMYDELGMNKEVTLFIPYFGAISVEVKPQRSPSSGNPGEMSNDVYMQEFFHEGLEGHDRNQSMWSEDYGKQEDKNRSEYSQFNEGMDYGVDFDWERLMLGNELDQDWNVN